MKVMLSEDELASAVVAWLREERGLKARVQDVQFLELTDDDGLEVAAEVENVKP